jgi:phosphatidylserine/phosphatidylglycerophosphate/cardiolipin synthase-like enzyme
MIKKNIFAALVMFYFGMNSALADSIQTYFNHNQNKSYTDPYYQRSRVGDNLEDILLNAISSAQSTISLAVYQLDLPLVAEALVAKKRQGVDIKIILENTNAKVWQQLSPEEIAKQDEHGLIKYKDFLAFADLNKDGSVNRDEQLKADSILILQTGGISWIDDTSDGSKGSGLMHHKFMIVDGKILVTGTANFTRSCVHGDFLQLNSKGNANSILKIESKSIIDFFQAEFDEMYISHRFGVKKSYRGSREFKVNGSLVKIQFSPTAKKYGWENSTNGLIAEQLSSAKKSSDAALFVFSEQKIVDAMQSSHEKGMNSRTLIDPSFATRYYSELLDILGVEMKSPTCKIEPDNNPWLHPSTESGFALLDQGDVLHHKFAVIDQHKVIVGSHNWSDSANKQNDEALFVIDDVDIAKKYTFEFETLIKKSVLGVPAWLSKKISALDQQCLNTP